MKYIKTDRAPAPIGPYSQAIEANGTVYTSGQIAIDVNNANTIPQSINEQTHLVIKNLDHVLNAAGLNLANVVKTTIYLKNMDDFAVVNSVYSQYFDASKPARSTVEVSRLPKDVRIEMDCVAVR